MSQLIFTLDFHQLLKGELQQNTDCTISYDPQRLAAGRKDFVHGSPDFMFTAHLLFDDNIHLDVPLYSPSGIVRHPDIALDGSGSMLNGRFTIPENTKDITIWITMEEKQGMVSYDSGGGKNYHFRVTAINAPMAKAGLRNLATAFIATDTVGQVVQNMIIPIPDVQITKASLTDIKQEGMGKLGLAATSILDITQLIIRYRVLNQGNSYAEKCVPLSSAPAGQNQFLVWNTPDVNVPYGAVIVYDVQYLLDGNWNTMNNNGYYYSVSTQS